MQGHDNGVYDKVMIVFLYTCIGSKFRVAFRWIRQTDSVFMGTYGLHNGSSNYCSFLVLIASLEK